MKIVGSPQLETSTLNAKHRSGLPIGQRPFTPAVAAPGGPADPWAWWSVQRIGSNNPHYPEIISQPIPANNRPLHQSENRASSDLEQGRVYRSWKITLIECNAKCRFLKDWPANGLSGRCFKLSEAPSPRVRIRVYVPVCSFMYTDKKEYKIFLICKEIQRDPKSYMTHGLHVHCIKNKCHSEQDGGSMEEGPASKHL